MEPQEEEQTLKMIFEGIRGIMGRKIPFTLHRTEEAFLVGPGILAASCLRVRLFFFNWMTHLIAVCI